MTERSFWWETNDTGDGPAAGYSQENLFSIWRMFAQGANAGGIFPDYLNMLEVSGSTSPIDVDNGAAIVYGSPYENTSAKTVVIPTPAGDTRVDRIVLRMSWSAQTVRITRIAGSEGSGAPGLVQNAGTTWDIPLALAIIDTGGAIIVTDEREWITPVGAGAILNAMLADGAVSDAKFTGQLSPARGGTGVNNADRTLAVNTNSGTVAFSSTSLTLTIPATGTAVTEAGTQTLTNKTLTTPVISSIVNSGTLSLPTSTDTLVGRNTTDTLTNKTLTTPTIGSFANAPHNHTNAAGGGQLSLTAAVTGILPSANGGTGIDNGGRTLTINTNSGTISFSAASSTFTIPATGTGVTTTASQTLSNKQYNGNLAEIYAINTTQLSLTSGNNNNVDLSGGWMHRIVTGDAGGSTITGFAGGDTLGPLKIMTNVSANNITIANNSSSSSASNRIRTPTGSSYTWLPNQIILFYYVNNLSSWCMITP